MAKRILGMLAILAGLGAVNPGFAQQAPMSPADVAKAKTDAAAALQNYMTVFSAQDAKGVWGTVWSHPSITITANGAAIVDDDAKQIAQAEGLYKSLIADGWVKTVTPSTTVCLLNPAVALVSGDFQRVRKDGSVISASGTVNIFAKIGTSWKMVARIVGAVGKIATCDDGAPATQAASTPEVAKVKGEVAAALVNYMTQYSARNAKAVAQDVYSHPGIQIGANGVTVIDPAKQEVETAARAKQMEATGWDKSAMATTPSVCLINANAALASGRFVRTRKDGSFHSDGGETDLFVKTKDGWKMVTLIGTDASKVVTCKD